MKISSKRKQEYLAPSCYISSLKNTWQIRTCQDIEEPLFHGKEARIEDAELASKVYGWMDGYFNFAYCGFTPILATHQKRNATLLYTERYC